MVHQNATSLIISQGKGKFTRHDVEGASLRTLYELTSVPCIKMRVKSCPQQNKYRSYQQQQTNPHIFRSLTRVWDKLVSYQPKFMGALQNKHICYISSRYKASCLLVRPNSSRVEELSPSLKAHRGYGLTWASLSSKLFFLFKDALFFFFWGKQGMWQKFYQSIAARFDCSANINVVK